MKVCMSAVLVTLVIVGVGLGQGAQAAQNTGNEHNHESSLSVYSLVKPLGIATLCFVSVTFLTGLFRRKIGKKFLKLHLPLAIASLALGVTHGTLVLVLYG